MVQGFSVTFERWDESAYECGDTDDRGYVVENVSLTDAIRLGLEVRDPSWLGHCEPDDSRGSEYVRWLTFDRWNDCTCEKLQTGIEESRSLHIPDNVTKASRKRIVRLFNVRGA